MTRFRGRLTAARTLRNAIFPGIAALLCLFLHSSARAGATNADWEIPYGREFWKVPVTTPALWSAPTANEPPPPDINHAIERVQHAFQWADNSGAWTLNAGSFQVRGTSDHIEFQPTAAGPNLDSPPLALNTLAVRFETGRPDTDIIRPVAGPWSVRGNTAQRRLGSALELVEHVEASVAGIEVTWILHQPTTLKADLVIDWQLSGRRPAAATDAGWRLAGSEPQANVLVGEAVAVDSQGRRLRLEMRPAGHGLSIIVPEGFLSTAVFPVAIDPLISAEFDLDQPVTRAAPSAQFAPALASDGTNHLVVWHDNRNGSQLDLYATRVATNGTVLDPSGFAITTALNDQWYPAVAFNGTNYLVAWQDARSGGQDIYAARVTPAGTVLETNGLPVVTSASDQRLPAVASLNGDFLVVWQDGRNGTANQDIYASRIKGGGLLIETNGFLVSNAANSQSAPAVGVVGAHYVAAWHDFRSGVSLDVYAARVSNAGAVLDANGIAVSTAANDQWNVSVAGNGSTGLITWQDGRNGADEDVFGARLNEAGTVLDAAGLSISQQPGQQRQPAVSPFGADFLVAWQDSRAGGSFDVYSTVVSTASGAVSSATGTLLSDAPNDQRLPAITVAGNQALVVWEDIRTGTATDIFGTRIDPNGTSLDGGNLLVSTVANSQETPAVASNGSLYLAVWRDYRADANGDIRGARIAADGTSLDPQGIAICNAGNYQLAPRVASSGGDFLVVWQDFRNGAHEDILGARVTGAGNVLDPNGLLISTALGAQRLPGVAGTAGGYLVVWQDRRSGSSDDIFGARVGSDGVIQDPNGLPICEVMGDQKAPAAAALNDLYFIAWEDFRGGVSNRVYGTTVQSGGQVGTANGFALSSVPGEQLAPRLAASTNQFLAAWQGQTNANGFDIFGTRISAAGVVQETNSITINASTGDQTRPGVAAKGGDFLVTWEDQRVAGRTNLYSTRVTANAAVLEPAGVLAAPDTGRLRHPAMASVGGDYLLVYQTLDSGNVPRSRGLVLSPAALPTVSLSPGASQFVAGNGPVSIDPAAILVDGESANFEGGTLTVDLTANATGNDRLSIRHQGAGIGQIGVSGNTVSYGGVLIGFFTGGTSGTSSLLVIFSAAANGEAVEALARQITFNNMAAQPFTQPRTVRFALNLTAGAGQPTTRIVNVVDAGSIPLIVTQPVGETVSAGGNVTLSVVASGSQPITYQWRLNGVNIAGATNATHTIPNLQAAAAGAYTVVVGNQYDYVISEVASVAYFDVAMYAGLTVAGPVGSNYRIEWRPAFGDTSNWQTLTNITLGAGSQLHFDPGSGRQQQRYYRAIREE